MAYRVAVIGATGNVGREILQTLSERNFPASEVLAVGSQASVGKEVSFGEEKTLIVRSVDSVDFSTVDFALMSVGAKVSKEIATKIAGEGCLVIDNSSAFRMDPDVPLVVPEVNEDVLQGARVKNVIASPNCVAIPLSVVLAPLHRAVPIRRVVVSTYQSVSGAGRAPMDELFRQTRAIFVNDPIVKEEFPKQIAFNVIPHIDDFDKEGETGEEIKIRCETQKIVDPAIELLATCVRVPVFIGHALSVSIECEDDISDQRAREILKHSAGVSLIDYRTEHGYITPLECAGEDSVYVSRIRRDRSVPHGLALWVACDNLRKGAALNTVQIAEKLIEGSLM